MPKTKIPIIEEPPLSTKSEQAVDEWFSTIPPIVDDDDDDDDDDQKMVIVEDDIVIDSECEDAAIEDTVIDDPEVDDAPLDDSVVVDNEIIDLTDIPFSCKNDLFSDQFVEQAAPAIDSDDILNMEIIFDKDGVLTPLPAVTVAESVFSGGEIYSIHSIADRDATATTVETSHKPPFITSDNTIQLNAKNSAKTPLEILFYGDEPAQQDTSSITSTTLCNNLSQSHPIMVETKVLPMSQQALASPVDSIVIYDADTTSLSPAEHVPDIEQPMVDTSSDDSQHSSHSVASSADSQVCCFLKTMLFRWDSIIFPNCNFIC